MVVNLYSPHCKMEMKEDKEIVHSPREGGRENMSRGLMMVAQQWIGIRP